MITQKAISAKLDYATAEMLEQEAYATGVSKNRILNKAIMHYIETLDTQRRARCGQGAASDAADPVAMELGKYILNNLTYGQQQDAHFIAQGLGCSLQHLFSSIITRGLEDYKKRPFSYL